MLATGRYAQWRSRFLRYIDTRPNGDALRTCILEGSYTPTTVVVPAVPVTNDSAAVHKHTVVKTPMNMSSKNKAHYQSKKKAIHLILTGIGDEIYSTVDACKTTQEISQRTVNVGGARENVGSPVVEQSGIQCYNCKEFGHFAKECRKPKRVKDSTYYKKKMLLCKQAKKGVPLQAEQSDWLANTDEEIDEQELEAHYTYMAKIQEVPTDSFLVALQTKQTEFEKYKACNDRIVDYDKLELSQECVSNDVMYTYLHSLSGLDAHNELQCLYLHKVKECDCLALKLSKQTESVSKEVYTELLRSFAKLEKHSISLELALQEYKNIAISELKKLIDKCKEKSMETKFEKPSIVRQPNAQRIPKPLVLGVNHKTNVSRPHHRSTQMKENVVPNNSQVKLKKTKVEYHPRIPSISNKTKFVTACNDSLNSKTSNVPFILAMINLQQFLVMEIWFKETSRSTGFLTSKASITISSQLINFVMRIWRLSHLNFDYINLLSKKDVVIGLPKLKYVKDQLCSSCEVSKAKRSSFMTKTVPGSKGQLNLLHMDLCGPMRVVSINGKKYILVIVDDYSRYTWTLFLCSKDETPKVLNDFLTMIQKNLQALVISVRTDRGIDFLNKTLHAFFKEEGIRHQTSTPRTPEQNGVVERQNRTLVCSNDALNFKTSFVPLG
nr:retrovirus-related Pol polyprotein from transposon TNT 1-94 [Tanacetum cinerariifolium]